MKLQKKLDAFFGYKHCVDDCYCCLFYMNYFSCANQDLLIWHTLDVMHYIVKKISLKMWWISCLERVILYQCGKIWRIWIFGVDCSQLQKEKKENLLCHLHLMFCNWKTFIHIIEELKIPTSYSSTFKKWIHMGTSKLKGLKAHDYYVLM